MRNELRDIRAPSGLRPELEWTWQLVNLLTDFCGIERVTSELHDITHQNIRLSSCDRPRLSKLTSSFDARRFALASGHKDLFQVIAPCALPRANLTRLELKHIK
jgi:hypothetical protein